MKIVLISEDERFSVNSPGEEEWQFLNLKISGGTPSFTSLLRSAFATPARYLMEMFQRLLRLEAGRISTPKILFNPLFKFDRTTIFLVLARAAIFSHSVIPVVFHDRDGVPIAYLLPASLTRDDAKLLSILSCVDIALDQKLLAEIVANSCAIDKIPLISASLAASMDLSPRFYAGPYFEIYKWVARTALETFRILQKRGEAARSIPFAVVMPHHAGDVLFLSLASRHTPSHFSKVVVNQAYADIVKSIPGNLDSLPIKLGPMNRGEGGAVTDWQYFASFEKILPRDCFYYYARPTSDYDKSTFHLLDQFAFMLGRQYLCAADLLAQSKPMPLEQPVPLEEGHRFNVLLHFDSGWHLKIYPFAYQQELVRLLTERGYNVTILDGKYPLQAEKVSFQSYQAFQNLLNTQHILVGMDSFPAHYAAHVAGLPTLCLFSSTQPENSNAPSSRYYRYLEKGLSCRPCGAAEKCPLNGTSVCNNFSEPAEVVHAVEEMLRAVYQILAR